MRTVLASLFFSLAAACGSADVQTDAAPPAPACAASNVTEGVTVSNTFGPLQGTLTLPAGCGPFPALLIIAGSGATDRDGNGGAALHTDTYRLLAEGLRARGVATLRYDKAGVGASRAATPGSEYALRFEMDADDAALFVSALRGDPRISSVTVAGHSEGALLGLLVAQQLPLDGYVSIAGSGRPIGAVLHEQLAKQISGPLLAQSEAILAQLEAGNTVSDVPSSPPDIASLFRASVQPYLISWMKYDPAREFASLSTPALIVQGTTDIQIDVADAQLLSAARADAELLIIDGMSHVLKAATLDATAQQQAYTDPSLPVVPELIEHLASAALR